MKNLEGAIALVTGAGSGIGREITLALARAGCHVLVNDVVWESAEKVAHEVRALGRKSEAFVADVSSLPPVEEMCRKVLQNWGRVDILVSNVGIYVVGRLMDVPMEEWERSMNVNLWSHIYTTRVLLPEMVKKRRGHIVYISSAAALWGHGYILPYVTTKFAVCGFAEAIAAQARPFNVGVSVVCPTYVKTGFLESAHVYGGQAAKDSVATKGGWTYRRVSLEPKKVAQKVVRGIRHNRFLVLTDFTMRLAMIGKLLFPQLFLRINGKITDWALPPPKPEAGSLLPDRSLSKLKNKETP
jgi:NAD(P)-dependent dehydrogenase (short-subunit alcohol dehydrogenase family)